MVAAVLALLGGGLLYTYVQGADLRAMQGQQPANVLVVTAAIPKGTPGDKAKGSVAVKQVPAGVVVAGALTSPDQLNADLVADTDLMVGEQVLSSRFVEANADTNDPVEVPEGMQQVSIVLPPQRVMGSRLKAGDQVGFFASFEIKDLTKKDTPAIQYTHLILEQVLVTRVSGATETPAGQTDTGTGTQAAPSGNVMVTLALKAPDAEKVVFAAEWGKIWLSLQREDTDNGGTRLVHPGNIYK